MPTDNVYIPQEGAIAALDAWVQSADGPVLAHLYDNNPAYIPTRVLADYQEASFVGYAPVGPFAWTMAITNGAGKAQVESPGLNFRFTGGSGTAVVYGLYLTDDPATRLLAVVPFLSPFIFSPANPALNRVVQLTDISEL